MVVETLTSSTEKDGEKRPHACTGCGKHLVNVRVEVKGTNIHVSDEDC